MASDEKRAKKPRKEKPSKKAKREKTAKKDKNEDKAKEELGQEAEQITNLDCSFLDVLEEEDNKSLSSYESVRGGQAVMRRMNSLNHGLIRMSLTVKGMELTFLIDSSACVCIIPVGFFQKFGKKSEIRRWTG